MTVALQEPMVGSDPTTSVQRAFQILDCFQVSGPLLGVSQVARLAGLPKSTAFRLLSSLIVSGYVERQGSMYRLGWRVFELGARATHLDPAVRESILPLLVELQVRTGHTVHLGVLHGSDVLYLEKLPGRSGPRTPTSIGTRMPASCAAVGKALLAFSPPECLERVARSPLTRRTAFSITEPRRLVRQVDQVKSDGLAVDKEEVALGLTCLAAPLLYEGQAWAALSVSGSTALVRNRAAHALLPDVAQKLSVIYADNAAASLIASTA
jgi:IclR family KDG regulon transcriptional repressor